MKPGERAAWRMIQENQNEREDSPPHGELQSIVDHIERHISDENDYDDVDDYDDYDVGDLED